MVPLFFSTKCPPGEGYERKFSEDANTIGPKGI
jgi:hypothetical protein